MRAVPTGPLPLAKRTSVVLGAVASLPIMGLGVGTGGTLTFDYLRDRGERGYKIIDIDQRAMVAPAGVSLSPRQQLEYVRKIIPGAVTEFARALNVSRQAIYDWQAAKPVAAENAVRIRDLAAAAHMFETAGISPTALLMRRRISAEGTFFDLVHTGRSAEQAASALIEIIRAEARQLAMLRRRLGAGAPSSRNELDDVGAPTLKEED